MAIDFSTLDLLCHSVASGYGGSDSAFTLGAASTALGIPARAVPAAMDGETVDYFAFYSTTEYEIGTGAYTHSGTTIARADVDISLSSNSNNRVAFSGAPTLVVQPLSGRMLQVIDTLLDLETGTAAGAVNQLGGATSTGTGGLVRATSPTLVTPVLGTPASGTLTNATGLPVGGVSFTGTDRLLGRSTAGAGVGEAITCTAAGRAILDDADAAAQRTTLGAAKALTVSAETITTGNLDIEPEISYKITCSGINADRYLNVKDGAAGDEAEITIVTDCDTATDAYELIVRGDTTETALPSMGLLRKQNTHASSSQMNQSSCGG